jgi:hypothetical protein
VIVIAHSYGAVVATEAISARHVAKMRSFTSATGGIVKLVYVAGFILIPGKNLCDAVGGGQLPPFIPADVSSKGWIPIIHDDFYFCFCYSQNASTDS